MSPPQFVEQQAVVRVTNSTSVGPNNSYLELLTAARYLSQNSIRILLRCKLLHAADLKLEIDRIKPRTSTVRDVPPPPQSSPAMM